MAKKASKSATTKKAFQDALKKKAAEKAASSNVLKPDDAPVEVTSPEVEASPKHNEEAFKKALELLLCTYPADGRNKRSDFSAVLSLLLRLNVDTASTKEISVETEKALNILGFTSSKMDGKVSILKEEISDLVVYLFNGYQKMHPMFCAINADILHNCPTELENISKKLWHPVIKYLACQNASTMTEEDAKHLTSGNSAEIADVLKNVKCAELNPNDFPSYEEEQTEKVTVIDEVYPEDRVSSPQFVVEEENVEEEEVPEVETTPEPSSVAPDITSKQNNSIAILFHTIKVLKEYGDQLRSLEAEGFVIEDAQALVEANALGFSFNELLHNEKMVETLSSIVNSLK